MGRYQLTPSPRNPTRWALLPSPHVTDREVRPRGKVSLLGPPRWLRARGPRPQPSTYRPHGLAQQPREAEATSWERRRPRELPGWFRCGHRDASPVAEGAVGYGEQCIHWLCINSRSQKSDSESHQTALKSSILSPELRDSFPVRQERGRGVQG